MFVNIFQGAINSTLKKFIDKEMKLWLFNMGWN